MPRLKKSAAVSSSKSEIRYPKIQVILRAKDDGKGPLTVDEAKELIGWTEEPADEDWGKQFALKDTFGRKVRLTNNPTNRPLKKPIADRYALEFLRGVWKLNLETVVFGQTGEVRDGQHRLVGFILAEQQRQIDQKKWGADPLTMEVLLGFGVSDDQETADSFDKGQSRSLDDVIYRHEQFGEDVSEQDQKKISKALAGAIRLVWLRSGGKQVSSAPHFPHSEAMAFYKEHPGILDSVLRIVKLDSDDEGNTRLISSLISPAYAAALHYLMGDVKKRPANEFWSSFASGEGLSKGSPILALRTFLVNSKAGSGKDRDGIVGACIKAWEAFLAEESLTTKTVRLKQRKNDAGKFEYAEFPRIGGIDSEPETEEELNLKQKIVLSKLCDYSDEISFEGLSELSGLPVSACRSLCYTGKNNLYSKGLVEVSEYEDQPMTVTASKSGVNELR